MRKFFALLSIVLAFSSLGFTRPPVPVWSSQMTITMLDSSADASYPQVVLDLNGNAVAVWVETDMNGDSNIVTANLPTGSTTWSSPMRLSTESKSFLPNIGMDSNGNAIVIWLESTDGIQGAVTTNTQASSVWGTAMQLSLTNAATEAQISVGGNLNAVAVWLESSTVNSATCEIGTWGSVETISPAGAEFPQVALDRSGGYVIASWHLLGMSPAVNSVYVATKNINNPFNSPVQFSDGINEACFARPAINQQGDFTVIWYSANVSIPGVLFDAVLQVRGKFNGVLGSIQKFTDLPGLRDPKDLVAKVAFDAVGDTVAVWNNSTDGSKFYIANSYNLAQRLDKGYTWLPLSYLGTNDIYALDLDIAVAGFNALSIWTYRDQSSGDIRIASALRGLMSTNSSWTPNAIITTSGNNAQPNIDAIQTSSNPPSLTGVAVWVNNPDDPMMNNTLQWAGVTFSASAVVPPTNPSVSVTNTDLGVFNEISKTISWTQNPSINISEYRVYRFENSVPFMVGSVSGLLNSFTDFNRTAATDTYGIASVDNYGNQSTMIITNG